MDGGGRGFGCVPRLLFGRQRCAWMEGDGETDLAACRGGAPTPGPSPPRGEGGGGEHTSLSAELGACPAAPSPPRSGRKGRQRARGFAAMARRWKRADASHRANPLPLLGEGREYSSGVRAPRHAPRVVWRADPSPLPRGLRERVAALRPPGEGLAAPVGHSSPRAAWNRRRQSPAGGKRLAARARRRYSPASRTFRRLPDFQAPPPRHDRFRAPTRHPSLSSPSGFSVGDSASRRGAVHHPPLFPRRPRTS
jgi:hypothetical protein